MKEVGGKGINLDASIVVEITLKELIGIRDSISLVGWSKSIQLERSTI